MAATNLKVSRETLIQSFTALDTAFEQTVEKDIVLPDYCPDVFRILKCRVIPKVVSQSINGDRLTVDTEAVIRVLYLSQSSGKINLIESKQSYSKTLELGGDAAAPIVSACAKAEQVSCRVVNQRRVDIRGVFSVKVNVTAECKKQFITGAEGEGIQLKRVNTVFPAKRLTAAKRVTVVEELELGGAKPNVGAVLRTDCTVTQQENKVISGKLITKGEAGIELLYTPAEGDSAAAETMRFSIPYSQIIDMEGLDDSFDLRLDVRAASCEIIPRSDEGGSLECELVLLVSCEAVRYESCEAVVDAFSTLHGCTVRQSGLTLGAKNDVCQKSFEVSGRVSSGENEIQSISCAWCEAGSVSVREAEGKSVVSGNVTMSAVGVNTQGIAIYLENDAPFECELDTAGAETAQVTVRSCSYRLSDESGADIRAELCIEAVSAASGRIEPIDDITLDDSEESTSGRYALKLCRVGAGEELWDIAKRCRTSVSAMIEENGMTSDVTEEGGMLLIPMTN